jgi:hypothetical protein
MTGVGGWLLILFVGTVGGLAGAKLDIPVGGMFGACFAVIVLKLAFKGLPELPPSFNLVVEIAVGVMIGAGFSPELFHNFGKLAVVVLGTSFFLVAAGAVLAVIFIKLGLMDPLSAFLATNPGGLTGLVVLAKDMHSDLTVVFLCHFVRLMLVLITAPLLVRLGMSWMGGR